MLFKDSNTLREYASLTEIEFASCIPTLRMVEQTHILPILGKDLYNSLNSAVNEDPPQDPLAETWADLLLQCRMVIGPLFCFYHADKADVKFGDSGMQRSESANNKVAYQEQRTKFKEANLAEGEKALELLIQFLEDNIQNYEEWTNSDNFKEYRALFIKTGTEFQKMFPSATPYRNYFLMRSKMQDVEENNIRTFLGEILYTDLKTKTTEVGDNLGTEEKELLTKLKKAIAFFTVSFSIPFLNVRIGSNGITVPAAFAIGTNDNDLIRGGVTDKALSLLISSCNTTGEDWLENARKYLLANKIAFPDWPGHPTTNTEIDCEPNDHAGGAYGLM